MLRRRLVVVALSLALAAAAGAAVVFGSAPAYSPSTLVVTDEHGRALWRVPVTEGTPVVLQYTNSIYLAPTWERFVVEGWHLRLVEVASTREAVLEYNRLPSPYRREGSRVAAPVSGVALQGFRLRVGARGAPVLHVGGAVLPVFQAGTGEVLQIKLSAHPRGAHP